MKKKLFFLFIAALAIAGCKKKSDSAEVKSQWTFNGTTYTATNASYEPGTHELFVNDDNGNFVRIFFSSIGKPATSSTLTVLDYAANFTNPSQCSLQVGNLYGSNPIQPLSTGKAGDVVKLTVSASGKLTATFSDITVADGGTTKTVSGTIVEQ